MNVYRKYGNWFYYVNNESGMYFCFISDPLLQFFQRPGSEIDVKLLKSKTTKISKKEFLDAYVAFNDKMSDISEKEFLREVV